MSQKKQSEKANTKKRNRALLAKGKALSQQHENFARLLFQGATIADAAEKCGFSFSYARKLAQESVIKERRKQLNEEYMADSRKLNAEGYQEVTITRNEIINLLADIARNCFINARARVAALAVLADIFSLRARNLTDVWYGAGWFDDETIANLKTGELPERIRDLFPPDMLAAFEGGQKSQKKQKVI